MICISALACSIHGQYLFTPHLVGTIQINGKPEVGRSRRLELLFDIFWLNFGVKTCVENRGLGRVQVALPILASLAARRKIWLSSWLAD